MTPPLNAKSQKGTPVKGAPRVPEIDTQKETGRSFAWYMPPIR